MRNYILTSVAFFLLSVNVLAQTTVAGNVSGIWTLNKSPYLIIDNCTVPNGATLTIEPGATVVIGTNLRLDVYGQIIAKGKLNQRITIKAPNANVFFDKIYVQHSGQQKISQFEYCDISNARVGIQLRIANQFGDTMLTAIKYSSFRNCLEYGIYGESLGRTSISMSSSYPNNPDLNPVIEYCIFDGTNNGAVFFCDGDWNGYYQPNSRGKTSPKVKRCIFKNLKGYALRLWPGGRPGTSYPIFQNNTVVNGFVA